MALVRFILIVAVIWSPIVVNSYLVDIVAAIINIVVNLVPNVFNPITTEDRAVLEDQYDFIIVGSGSAGSVLAARLSEIPNWKILLLEAGTPGNALTSIPLLAPLWQLSPWNWKYTTERQDGICLGMYDQVCAWPRGKALGGSTVINYMIYTRGNPKDFDKWAALGNDEWSYGKVLPYYLKSEECHLEDGICSSSSHSRSGDLSVDYPYKSELGGAFVDAGVELGSKVVDYNSDDFMGFSQIQANIKHGRRHSTAEAFLRPASKRENLKIVTSALVTKILIDPVTKSAYGVKVTKNGWSGTINATKEVIISAGTFNSPKLLMLSGVGPEDHLAELGIPPIQNLPVGQTMYDHLSYISLAFTMNQTVVPRIAALLPSQGYKWLVKGTGIYTSLSGIEGIAYINTGSIPDSNYPDIELLFVGAGSLELDFGLIVANELRIKREIYNKMFKPIEFTPAWSVFPVLLHPKSRGYLKLRSRNPLDAPLLYSNFLTDSNGQDLNTLVAGIRYIEKLSRTEAMQKYNSTLHSIPVPGCEMHLFDSDDYWKCAIRVLGVTLHHQIGTCKMGPNSDSTAIVNQRLQVYGIHNLRVADASVIPVTISAHTNAPSIMIGEKAADFIKDVWNNGT